MQTYESTDDLHGSRQSPQTWNLEGMHDSGVDTREVDRTTSKQSTESFAAYRLFWNNPRLLKHVAKRHEPRGQIFTALRDKV